MKKIKSSGRNSKDFCIMWGTLYNDKYKQYFHIRWLSDGIVFKRLMSTYSNLTLTKLIKFVFRDNGATTAFLRSTGYNIAVFERDINKYRQYVENGCVDEAELNLEIPYWDDSRFSFMSTCINSNDFESLLRIPYNSESRRTLRLFLQKVKRQDKKFFYKAKVYYKRWKRFASAKRRRIKDV